MSKHSNNLDQGNINHVFTIRSIFQPSLAWNPEALVDTDTIETKNRFLPLLVNSPSKVDEFI